MFAFLRGTIIDKELTGNPVERLILEVSGVGFEVWVAGRTLLSIGEPGDEVVVHTWLSVRENDLTVFGFGSSDERKLFQLLMTVSGVGPRLAIAVVGTFGVTQFVDAVLAEDKKMISQAPGVGQKVAQRIIIELKSKVEAFRVAAADAPEELLGASTRDEVSAILEGLGYTITEINMALKKAKADEAVEDDVETLVRYSLKVLGGAGVSSA